MADRHQGCNDHDRRNAAIVRLASKIGIALCRDCDGARPLSENAWVRLEQLRLELDALRNGAAL
jgi:hypothetical protein